MDKRFRLPGGLAMLPSDRRQAVLATAGAIAGVSLFVAVLDGWLFRGHLPAAYVDFYRSALLPRSLDMGLLAALEEVKYRLLVMTGLAALASVLGVRLNAVAFTAIILLAQFINVGALVVADPLYATLRYWLVGSVWGWLYWRHGWLSALAGHSICHLVLDPLLLIALA